MSDIFVILRFYRFKALAHKAGALFYLVLILRAEMPNRERTGPGCRPVKSSVGIITRFTKAIHYRVAFFIAAIAQLAERRPCNSEVVGSIPAGGTRTTPGEP